MENEMKYIKSNLKMNGFPKKTVEKQIQNLNGNTLLVILDKKVVIWWLKVHQSSIHQRSQWKFTEDFETVWHYPQ